MNYDDLSKINKEFAEEFAKINEEFISVFKKWIKKSPRATSVCAIHLPLTIIMNLITHDKEKLLPKVFPELPDVFIRFMRPFMKLKKKWGKISGKEFCKEYEQLHSSQFDSWFPSPEEKEEFQKWFENETNSL